VSASPVCEPPGRLPLVRERELVVAAKRASGDARQPLIDAFAPSVDALAHMYRRSAAVSLDELRQEGVVGLLRALERYDPAQGTPFWAYASWWVRQAMQQLVAELGRPVVLSDRAARHLSRLKEAQREHLRLSGREASVSELVRETGLTTPQVEGLMAAARAPRGLDERLGDSDAAATVGEQIADPFADDAYDQLPPFDAGRLAELIGLLSDRERAIVAGRFGLGGPELTLRQLAAVFGLSIERVRQIEEAALGKLRDGTEADFGDSPAGVPRRPSRALARVPA
jgi:RNA polymerase sigma factor (sigma-70 family)